MKNLFKYLLLTVLVSSMFYSCETTELELLTDPNALAPGQVEPNFLFNSIQTAYYRTARDFNDIGAELSRIDYMDGVDYEDNYRPNNTRLNNSWGRLYSGILPDLSLLESLQETSVADISFQIGASKILEAHLLMLMVDYFGDVVFSQANNPVEFPNPTVDSGQDVYNGAIALLDEAIALLTSDADSETTDLYYGGSFEKWIKLANTLKMRANLTQGNYNEVLNATNVISTTADDFEFKHGTQLLLPDTRHPNYADNYRSDGVNDYVSNWLLDLMIGAEGDLSPETDPRRRYYFYRQTWGTPGGVAYFIDVLGEFGPAGDRYISNRAGNLETLSCSEENTPIHLEFTPEEEYWCSMRLGYWGRDHKDPNGIPPDNFDRTAPGVYPAGGSFDWRSDSFPYVGESPNGTWGQGVGLGNGGAGAGIEPIILASYVEFWKAEANFMLGNDAATNLENAMTMSIAKVEAFGNLDSGANNMDLAPDATAISDFIALKVAEFNSASSAPTSLDSFGWPVAKDKLDILGEQFFVAMYGGGCDAYNFIRRTGYPRTLARGYASDPRLFPRTMFYPLNETNSNPNIDQKADLTVKTFWDNGAVNPAN